MEGRGEGEEQNRYRVFIKQHSAAIGCTKTYQSIGVTVHSHCVESFEVLLRRCEKIEFFLNTL